MYHGLYTVKRAALLLTAALCMTLCACAGQGMPAATEAPLATELDLRGEAAPDLAALAEQAQLVSLDLRGHEISSADYDALHAALPKCRILWSVPIAGERFDSNSAELTLAALSPADAAMLPYFPVLTAVRVTGGNGAETAAIAVSMPAYTFTWTVDIYGTPTESTATSIDLKGTDVGTAAELSSALATLPNLAEADLTGCALTNAEKAALREQFPNVRFSWTVDIGGVAVDSKETVLNFNAGNFASVEEAADAVRCFEAPVKVDMAEAGFGNEELETLTELFPEVKFAWIVTFGRFSVRTDAVAFSMKNVVGQTKRMKDADLSVLRYCTDLEALDLGHNKLSDISWIANLKKLKALILADNKISDISALEELDELMYVELFMNDITDVSALGGKEKLLDLNICFNEIADVTPLLTDTKMERCWISNNGFTQEQMDTLTNGLPDCEFNFTVRSSTYYWREHDRFEALMRCFKTGMMDPLLER